MNSRTTEKHINPENTYAETHQAQRPEGIINAEMYDTIMFSNVINVLIVIAFFVWLFRKYHLLSFLQKKRDEILETLHNLEEEKRIKQNQLEQTRTKVKNVNQDMTKIIDEGEHVAKTLSEQVIMDAETEAAEMQQKAHALIETERQKVSNQLINEVTGAAFIIAEQHIKEAIDERLHQKYINEFIDNLDNVKV